MKTNGKRFRRVCGPAQMALFAPEEMVRCAGGSPKAGCTRGDVVVAEEGRLETGPGANGAGESPTGMGGFQLVAMWHDRGWDPVRFFRRADGSTVVVFRVRDAEVVAAG